MFAYPLAEETVSWQPGSKRSQENAVAENNQYNFVMLVSSWSDSPIWFPMCLHKCGGETVRGSIRLVLGELYPTVNLLLKEECSGVMVIHIIEIAEFLLKCKKKKEGKKPPTKP